MVTPTTQRKNEVPLFSGFYDLQFSKQLSQGSLCSIEYKLVLLNYSFIAREMGKKNPVKKFFSVIF